MQSPAQSLETRATLEACLPSPRVLRHEGLKPVQVVSSLLLLLSRPSLQQSLHYWLSINVPLALKRQSLYWCAMQFTCWLEWLAKEQVENCSFWGILSPLQGMRDESLSQACGLCFCFFEVPQNLLIGHQNPWLAQRAT